MTPLFSSPLATTFLFPVSKGLTTLDTSYMWNLASFFFFLVTG